MKTLTRMMALLAVSLCGPANATAALDSPDRHVRAELRVARDGTLRYSVLRDGKAVIRNGRLGLILQGIDLEHGLKLESSTPIERVEDTYSMAVGKKREIRYAANEERFIVANGRQQSMELAFRVSNDGVAFRYVVDEDRKSVV